LAPEIRLERPEGYVWPSDGTRFEALAASAWPLSLERLTRDTDQTPKQTLVVNTTIRNPLAMSQHRSSSFSILVAIMRRHHMPVFSDDSSGHNFWTTLVIGALDDSWGVSDRRAWQRRYEWLLHYIRTSSLPQDAQIAKSILKDAMENLLAQSTHPCNIDTGIPTAAYLNPDLAPKWAKELLTVTGDIFRVEERLPARLPGFCLDDLCKHFGILIAPIWEESVHASLAFDQHSNLISRRDRNCPEAAVTSEQQPSNMNQEQALFDETIDPDLRAGSSLAKCDHLEVSIETPGDSTLLPAATGWCNKRDYQEAFCDEPDSMSARPFPKRVDERNEEESIPLILDQPATRSITLQSLEITPPESPPPYLLPSSIANSQWHDDETHYLKNLIERNLTWRQRYQNFVGRFGGCRTYNSVLAASRKLYSDCPIFSKRKSDKRWTVTDTEYLRHLIATEVDWAHVAEMFQKRPGQGPRRSEHALRSRAHDIKIDISRLIMTEPWTDEQVEFLKSLVQNDDGCGRYRRWIKSMQDEFGVERTEDSIRGQIQKYRDEWAEGVDEKGEQSEA
ncbi:hypothetical protein EDB81DRAFT_931544, partial [Dactylonectria macrodidyma]